MTNEPIQINQGKIFPLQEHSPAAYGVLVRPDNSVTILMRQEVMPRNLDTPIIVLEDGTTLCAPVNPVLHDVPLPDFLARLASNSPQDPAAIKSNLAARADYSQAGQHLALQACEPLLPALSNYYKHHAQGPDRQR